MRDTEREAETQAVGEADSLRGARSGSRSQDPWMMTWAKGRHSMILSFKACSSLKHVLGRKEITSLCSHWKTCPHLAVAGKVRPGPNTPSSQTRPKTTAPTRKGQIWQAGGGGAVGKKQTAVCTWHCSTSTQSVTFQIQSILHPSSRFRLQNSLF